MSIMSRTLSLLALNALLHRNRLLRTGHGTRIQEPRGPHEAVEAHRDPEWECVEPVEVALVDRKEADVPTCRDVRLADIKAKK